MFTAGSRTGSLNTAVCASSLKGKTKQLYLDKGNKKTSNKKNMICCFIALFLPKFPSRVRIPKLELGVNCVAVNLLISQYKKKITLSFLKPGNTSMAVAISNVY